MREFFTKNKEERQMKKTISLLLALILITSLLQSTAFADPSPKTFDATITPAINSLGLDYDTMFSSSYGRALATVFICMDALNEGLYSLDYLVEKIFVKKNMFFSYDDKNIMVGFCVDKKAWFIGYSKADDTISYIKDDESNSSDSLVRNIIELTLNSEYGNCFELDIEDIRSAINDISQFIE